MSKSKLCDESLPALFQAADHASLTAQSSYYFALKSYLFLLVIAALISFYYPTNLIGALASASLFSITLCILIWLKVQKPEDTWYNGRAVAESVKTRTWRWVMKAEPYDNDVSDEQIRKEFFLDLKSILDQNRSLSAHLQSDKTNGDAISIQMTNIRSLPFEERLNIYKDERVKNQGDWYAKKSLFNKRRAKQWFVVSVILHAMAIALLLWRITDPSLSLPIEVVATGASAILTWLQAKKHNELNSSYSLAAHEIVLIKGEAESVASDKELSNFVVSSESAFSREHTQWSARKNV
ncbi:DUF4231 domain-containing protein [Moritella viscosa]|uniref:DUF4231 domain-containing protein n=1 Tax=Moritella viscosa TaxID=80854 RepID=A0A090KAP2_9GAMM|nr:DUF4231 domain-containing protein [Moritella viscosa]CED60903.1 putative uncharacterized phage membrane protein [Moritella viscosa]SGY95828.1 Putative uncharacterized protein [Moritella viscosa]SGZ01384.1 Putative uncharacterized protein [Moritella viscosa]SGZ02078.1 Putative uncharacterized protein [Moritella viscosa]SGZ08033.1 Putative uncharacterized protein [Moritella viscosa]